MTFFIVCSIVEFCAYGELRGMPGPSHVRRGGTGIREAFLRSSLSFHGSSPARVGQGSAAICFLLLEAPGSAVVSRSACTQSRCPGQFRPHQNRRMVPPASISRDR